MNWQVFLGGLILCLVWFAWCVGGAFANNNSNKAALACYASMMLLVAAGLGVVCGGCV